MIELLQATYDRFQLPVIVCIAILGVMTLYWCLEIFTDLLGKR